MRVLMYSDVHFTVAGDGPAHDPFEAMTHRPRVISAGLTGAGGVIRDGRVAGIVEAEEADFLRRVVTLPGARPGRLVMGEAAGAGE